MNIPILRLPFDRQMIGKINARIGRALESGQLALGENNREFESRWRQVNPSPYAIACSSGTSALEILLRCAGVAGGDVIVPVNTFMATAFAAVNSGGRAVFADVSREDGCLTAESVAAAATPDTKAVMVVHIGGIISDEIIAIKELCAARGWALIEDCAHAHACSYDGTYAGNFGLGGAFSFFPTKVLMTGEGGAISTADEAVVQQARSLLNHGKAQVAGKMVHAVTGNNWRLSEVHAAIGVEILAAAEDIIAARQDVARQYNELLVGIPAIEPVRLPEKLSSTYYKYMVLCRDDGFDRAALKQFMRDRGVALTGEVYADLCSDQPVVKQEPQHYFATGDYAGARWFADHHFCLPLYPGLTGEQIEYVITNLKEYFS